MKTFEEYISDYLKENNLTQKEIDTFKKLVYSFSFSLIGQNEENFYTLLKSYKHNDAPKKYVLDLMIYLDLNTSEIISMKVNYKSQEEDCSYKIFDIKTLSDLERKIKEFSDEYNDSDDFLVKKYNPKVSEKIKFKVIRETLEKMVKDLQGFKEKF